MNWSFEGQECRYPELGRKRLVTREVRGELQVNIQSAGKKTSAASFHLQE